MSLFNDTVLSVQDTLSATVFATVMLFAGVDVAIFLALLGLTGWTCVSDDHRFLLTSQISHSLMLTNHTMELEAQHYLYNTTPSRTYPPSIPTVIGP